MNLDDLERERERETAMGRERERYRHDDVARGRQAAKGKGVLGTYLAGDGQLGQVGYGQAGENDKITHGGIRFTKDVKCDWTSVQCR